jgi:hypothetical protein
MCGLKKMERGFVAGGGGGLSNLRSNERDV